MTLWLRLGCGSGRQAVARQLLVTAGLTVASALLLVAAGVATLPRAATQSGGVGTCDLLPDGGMRCVDAPRTDGAVTSSYLVEPELRRGVVIGFLLCLVPLLVLVSVSSRVAARRRDERLAALRLAGATRTQVRRLAVLDALVGAGAGAVIGTLLYVVVRAALLSNAVGERAATIRATTPSPVTGALVLLALLVAVALGATWSLRRVEVGPLDVVRQRSTYRPRPWMPPVLVVTLAALTTGLLSVDSAGPSAFALGATSLVVIMLALAGSGAWITATTGRLLARRANQPALLLAARRMQDEPRAHARAMSSIVLVTFAATLALGALAQAIATGRSNGDGGLDDFARQGYELAAVAVVFSLVVGCAGVLVTTAEGLAERRRTLARAHATGIPLRTLRRSALLHVALPTLPATALAMISGLVVSSTVVRPSLVFAEVGAWPLALPFVAVAVTCVMTALTLPALKNLTSAEGLRTP